MNWRYIKIIHYYNMTSFGILWPKVFEGNVKSFLSTGERTELRAALPTEGRTDTLTCIHEFNDVMPSKAQGGRGHWTVYYTGPQSFIITFPYS